MIARNINLLHHPGESISLKNLEKNFDFFFFTLKRFCHTHIQPELLFGCEPRKYSFLWAVRDCQVLYVLCYEEAQDISITVELNRMGFQWKTE